MENRLVIAGLVERRPQTITSPAGIHITRFRLQHGSVQTEAGKERRATCSIEVVASGTAIQQTAQGLDQGSTVRVTGFLTRAERKEDYRLALHAQTIEICSA